MAVSASFSDLVKELFAPFGAISVRKMFGGAGIYCDDLFFAIIDDDAVYLKVDDETRKDFEARGLERFTYEMKDGAKGVMSYYNAPDEIFDEEDELRRWAGLALDAARRAARLKKKPAKRKSAK
jgi:DNA transformation protein